MKASHRVVAIGTAGVSLAVLLTLTNVPSASSQGAGWCGKVKISYFKGGSSDAFSDILEKGARAAAADTGAKVTIIGSGWDFPKMAQSLREEIAKKPDAISFMGHPGDAAIQPLAVQAKKAGIFLDYSNVPPAETLKNVGGGFVGANLRLMGESLATKSIKDFGLVRGDEAIVAGTFGVPGRSDREDGTVAVLEKAGIKVNKLNLNTLGDTNGNPGHRCHDRKREEVNQAQVDRGRRSSTWQHAELLQSCRPQAWSGQGIWLRPWRHCVCCIC
jgi:simple sugar transport system substrate-binding protein